MILNNANNILKNFEENANIRIKSKIDILIDNYLFLSRIKMENVKEEGKEGHAENIHQKKNKI